MARNLKLGEMLKQSGIIDEFQLNSALSYQRHWGGRFGESLIKLGYLSEGALQDFLARQFDLPQVELYGRKIPADVLAYIPASKSRELLVIPVERREISGAVHLVVAMTDPTNLLVIDSLQFMTGCRIKPALASADSIRNAIERHFGEELETKNNHGLELEELSFPISESVEPAPPNKEFRSGAADKDAILRQESLDKDDLDKDDRVRVSAKAFKRLEERYENLLTLLLDKGILKHTDLDELM